MDNCPLKTNLQNAYYAGVEAVKAFLIRQFDRREFKE